MHGEQGGIRTQSTVAPIRSLGGVPGDVGAWCAGGGAVWGGGGVVVSGAWAGDVAHGALGGLVGEFARLRAAAA